MAGGLALILICIRHSGTLANPTRDISLLHLPIYCTAMLQLGFDMTASQSRSLTFLLAMKAMMIRFAARPLPRRFRFRGGLIGNAPVPLPDRACSPRPHR